MAQTKPDKIFETLLEIGHEIAALEGAGDTGLGGGEYEIFITRGGVEYRVTVEAYWDNETDEPLRVEAAGRAGLVEALRGITETRWDAGAADACIVRIKTIAQIALAKAKGDIPSLR